MVVLFLALDSSHLAKKKKARKPHLRAEFRRGTGDAAVAYGVCPRMLDAGLLIDFCRVTEMSPVINTTVGASKRANTKL